MKLLPLNLHLGDAGDHNAGLAPYFRSYAAKQLQAWCKQNNLDLYADGLKIYTTIDSRMQRYAEAAADTHIRKLQKEFLVHWKGRNPWIDESHREIKNFLESAQKKTERYKDLKRMFGDDSLHIRKIMNTPVKMKVFAWNSPTFEKDTMLSPVDSIRYYKHFLQTGMMAMEVKTGHIKAWVGGINHKYFKYDHVKQGARQPGSTFKPIVYATSIEEQGYSPCERVTDIPRTFVLPTGGTWTAKNSSGGYSGQSYTLRGALAQSVNTVAAYLMEKLKDPKIVVDYAHRLGITTPLDPVPALCLGSSEVSVFDLVGAYATFANKGTWIEPNFILKIADKNGKVIFQKIPQKKEVISEQTAYIMTYLMRGSNEDGGTAWELNRYQFKKGNQIAAKTGTTSNYSDGWFVGMSKDLAVGVWTGGDDRSIHFRTIDLGAGAHMSLPTFARFLEQVYANQELMKQLGYGKGEFPKPEQFHIELDCSKYGISNRDSSEYFMPTGNPLVND
jgi:penicillin-binding protein 1A